jgi:hypothetical protein
LFSAAVGHTAIAVRKSKIGRKPEGGYDIQTNYGILVEIKDFSQRKSGWQGASPRPQEQVTIQEGGLSIANFQAFENEQYKQLTFAG